MGEKEGKKKHDLRRQSNQHSTCSINILICLHPTLYVWFFCVFFLYFDDTCIDLGKVMHVTSL